MFFLYKVKSKSVHMVLSLQSILISIPIVYYFLVIYEYVIRYLVDPLWDQTILVQLTKRIKNPKGKFGGGEKIESQQ